MAGIFRTANDQHAELRRHDIEPLGRILADPMQSVAATRARMILDVDDHLDTRQMGRKRSPVRAALGG